MKWLPPLTAVTALLLCIWLRFGSGGPVLVDLARAAPGVRMDLRYATANNFFHRRFYTDARALLRPSTAAKLAAAQREFAERGLHLKVWDAWRPLRVQREMWKAMPNPDYVADPAHIDGAWPVGVIRMPATGHISRRHSQPGSLRLSAERPTPMAARR